jgi:hydrogenase 3 maturation protease
MPAKTRGNNPQDLKNWLNGAKKIVIAGIGNPIREDDFVGVKIVQNLQGRVSEKVFLIECETVPENFMQQIVDFGPTHILLIDAAILGLSPGEWKLVDPQALTNLPAYSTHMLPLRIFCEYLAAATKAHIALLLIQPKTADFGEGLSPEIIASSQTVTNILLDSSLKRV